MKLEIHKADYDDSLHRDSIVAVLDSYASDPVGGGEPLKPEVRARLVDALRDHPTSLVLLAFADGPSQGQPVGIAICFLGFSTFQARPLLNIHDLAVVPDFRGQGVGRALLDAVEQHAVKRGCCKLTLEVQDDNQPARTLYERFGFKDVIVGNSACTRFLSRTL